MRILLVSGSLPPNPCGVGDYTNRLAAALQNLGADVVCLGGEPWSGPREALALRRLLKADPADVVHLQYPTVGYGRSLVPALLPLVAASTSFAVTMHEFSSFKKLRRPWFWTFPRLADMRIFTNDRERGAFERSFPKRKGIDEVIGIGSNIPTAPNTRRDERSISYFGLLTPGKGLDDFLCLAEQAASMPWTFRLIGAAPSSYAAYAAQIVARAKAAGISIHLDRDVHEVAELLARTEVAYLPFEASLSRGSLLAAFSNGAAVLTRHGPNSGQSIKQASLHVASSLEAFDALLELFQDDPKRVRLQRAARNVHCGWPEIARKHLFAYERAIQAAKQPRPRAERAFS